jgi:hypothetical protein
MKKHLLLSALIFIYCFASGQSENALDFDGVNDEVTVPSASSLIAGSSQITLSCWVYPTNASPVFPDYDGFCGFRNDQDADFYFVQLAPGRVEARFRNSALSAFTLVDSTLQLNAWQHYVLSYDGTLLSLYRDGQLKASISASGTIASTTEVFHMGNIPYSINNFYLQGKLDEVSLWNRSLNPNEVHCLFESYPDPADPGLKLYYKFNQGVPGGSNPGITSLTPTTGSLNGTLSNFALAGTLSNWINGTINYTSASATICPGQSISFGTQTLTGPGIYYEAFQGASGCDSVVRMDVVPEILPGVTIAGQTLTAHQNGAAYQWVDCNNSFTTVPGAVTQSFSPLVDGSYAVVITYNGCTDTSACYTVIGVGLPVSAPAGEIMVYPNPAYDVIRIKGIEEPIRMELTDVEGKTIFSGTTGLHGETPVASLAKGVYILKIQNGKTVRTVRVVKN